MGIYKKAVKSEDCKENGSVTGSEFYSFSSDTNPISIRGNFYINNSQSVNLSAEIFFSYKGGSVKSVIITASHNCILSEIEGLRRCSR
jgi:hypothetical protein